jgi:carboxyl-terminal processing protease
MPSLCKFGKAAVSPACVLGALLVPLVLAACGGGGGGSSTPSTASTGTTPPPKSTGPAPVSDDFAAVAQQCSAPRPASTVNPLTGTLYGDKQGTILTENEFVRDYVYDTYLWYADVPQTVDITKYVLGATVPYVNPANNEAEPDETVTTDYEVVDAYFNSQRSPLFTASNKPKDQFHFTYPTTTWVAIEQSGAVAGYGFTPQILESYPPRNVAVAFTDPNTPAALNNIARGAQIVSVDGVDVVNGTDVDTINAGLFSPVAGQAHTFGVLDFGATTARTVTMTAAVLTEIPVDNVGTVTGTNNTVGYMQFNEHIATAESALFNAMTTLSTANAGAPVADLVLDIRYNGGGLLDIASELASMIASSSATNGATFEKESFNDKNPFGLTTAQATTPFWQTTLGYDPSIANNTTLPHLNLQRVFIITTASTCSASEAIINSLRGVGVQVIQIGTTTCGKPYGFFPADNCSTTFFTIQFEGVNAAGFGGYADGFTPSLTGTKTGGTSNQVYGCPIADDYGHQLGDPAEANLAAALSLMGGATTCPAMGTVNAHMPRPVQHDMSKPGLFKPAIHENRFLDLPRMRARVASNP